jgi:lipopolysaccharide export LptBFGC system permease protein LptF
MANEKLYLLLSLNATLYFGMLGTVFYYVWSYLPANVAQGIIALFVAVPLLHVVIIMNMYELIRPSTRRHSIV